VACGVHRGADAAAALQVWARGVHDGQDIYMGEGICAHTADRRYVARAEVAHTVQQRGVSGSPQYKLEISEPGDASETEADSRASAMIGGCLPRSVAHRARDDRS